MRHPAGDDWEVEGCPIPQSDTTPILSVVTIRQKGKRSCPRGHRRRRPRRAVRGRQPAPGLPRGPEQRHSRASRASVVALTGMESTRAPVRVQSSAQCVNSQRSLPCFLCGCCAHGRPQQPRPYEPCRGGGTASKGTFLVNPRVNQPVLTSARG